MKEKNKKFDEYLEKLNSEIDTAIKNAFTIPTHGKNGTNLSFNKIIFVYLKYHEPNKLQNLKKDISDLEYKAAEIDVESLSRKYRTWFDDVQELFGSNIWILSKSEKQYKYDEYEACLLYQFLARYNDVAIWNKINKQYLSKYKGFVELYCDLPVTEKEELVRELKFIINLIIKLYVHRTKSENNANLRAHLNAVSQLPLLEVWELFRMIPMFKYDDYCDSPYLIEIVDMYNKYINNLSRELYNTTYTLSQKYITEVSILETAKILMNDEKVQKEPIMGGLINGFIDENNNPDYMEEMLNSLKEAEPECREASNLEEFHQVHDSVASQRTITKNKKHDKKTIKKLLK